MAIQPAMHVTVQVDTQLLAMLKEANERMKVLDERLDHMQDRLNRFGARLRHIEHLPGVAELIDMTKEAYKE